ncbi:hypothetical protein FOC4_g10002783 [Fusarium odoratissimum]|uniref:Uncharacterized protein n=1 Tax=Fusarium oxysporum f. sp. cubense (strain race 4) TaxID=2502994 RepID=N1S9X6_FUSC4|nr:hypothetical protein FOC4_g10002783 [Fusarium odoratissimum]
MTPKALTSLPSEIRQQIFKECLAVDGGYVYDVQADKLTNADAHLITPEMFAELELMCPGYQALLEIELVRHETWIHENNNREYNFEADKLRPAVCSMVRQFMKKVDLIKMNGKSLICPFRLFHNEADANAGGGLDDRQPQWTQGELREATSYCLKLISEAQPDEFARYVYKSLPHWIGNHPAEDFVNFKFNLWDIPSREHVANMLELLDIGPFVWELPATWHYAPLSFYDHVGKSVPQDRRSPEFEKPDSLLEHFTRRCREKLRFSATAAAIRFLQGLAISQRKQVRRVILHEDLPSVNLPSRHTQGLVPFVFGCMTSQRPNSIRALINTEEGDDMLPRPEIVDREFEASIYYWLLDAFAVVDSGLDTKCFTFVLEAGPHSDYCAELFQRVIQTEISKSKAWKICLETGLLASLRPTTRHSNTIRYEKDPRFEKLVEHLVNQASIFRCDFNPGVLLDVAALVEDARVRHGESIFDKWVSKWLFDIIPLPYDLYHDMMVAPNYEFQTRQEYIELRGKGFQDGRFLEGLQR